MAAPATAVEDCVKVIYSHTSGRISPFRAQGSPPGSGWPPAPSPRWCRSSSHGGWCGTSRTAPSSLPKPGSSSRCVWSAAIVLYLETWLVEQFATTWDEVYDEAEVLEHVVSDRMLDAIDRQLGHPRRHPHGDPIL